MKIGAHVSAADGLHNAPLNAAALSLECFQFFSRPPQSGFVKNLTEKEIILFKETCRQHNFTECYIHTPYILNMASDSAEVRHRTAKIIHSDLDRASALGVTAVMTHMGSASRIGDEKLGVKLVSEGLKEILFDYEGAALPFIEMSAGAGMVIGDSFEEISEIITRVDDPRIGVCFDTAHAFASGYDLRDETAVNQTLQFFDETIGLNRLQLIHINDSLVPLDSHKDRHAHLGEGLIGLAGFRALLAHPEIKNINLILETPFDDDRTIDIITLKNIRAEL